jgi:hypothetical protein
MLVARALPLRRHLLNGDLQSYDALSYWSGFDQPCNPILMHDELISEKIGQRVPIFLGVFRVRDNLAAAVRQFRQKSLGNTYLWADATHINQENLKEKSAQMSRMYEMYGEACRVSVWLGKGTSEAKETFEFLKNILNISHLYELIKSRENPDNWGTVGSVEDRLPKNWLLQRKPPFTGAKKRWNGSISPTE